MSELLWSTSPFDDDDDLFDFESGHADLAAEIREYADDDDDEFGFDPQPVTRTPPAPVVPEPKALPKKRAAAKKPVARKSKKK